jgi:sugar lactone lactonase YvrE
LRRLLPLLIGSLTAIDCGGVENRPSPPTCPGVCEAPTLSTLGILAGQPGGPGWVDGTLVAAHFEDPWAIKGDGQGHVYVADKNLIRAIDLGTGKVTSLAGIFGQVGSADGPGAQATFNLPSGLSIASGRLYLTDTENHTLRAIDLASASVTTLAGAPTQSGALDGTGTAARFREPEGLALDGSGHLFIADTDNNTIRQLDLATMAVSTLAGTPGTAGSADGIGAAGLFYKPKDLTIDAAGNLYVADALNESIRKVVPASGQVTTLATLGALPQGLAFDGSDVLASLTDNRVVRVAPDGTVTTLAGSAGVAGFVDGAVGAARFDSPAGLWNDGAGTVYVADNLNTVVRAIHLTTGTVSTLAGANPVGSTDGTGTAARFSGPLGIATDAASAYVADTGNDVIRKIDLATGKVTTLAGGVGQAARTDGALTVARFNQPEGLALDATAEQLYVADTTNRSIRRIDLAAGKVSTLALVSAADASFEGFDAPTGLALDGGRLFVTDYMDDIVAVIDLSTMQVAPFAGQYGAPGRADGTGTSAAFYGPEGLASDGRGNLYVADDLSDTLRKIDIATAAVSTVAGQPSVPGSSDGTGSAALFDGPVGVTANTLGDVFVSDSLNQIVRHVNAATRAVTTVVGTLALPGVRLGALPGQLSHPSALALTPAGSLLIVSESSLLVAH